MNMRDILKGTFPSSGSRPSGRIPSCSPRSVAVSTTRNGHKGNLMNFALLLFSLLVVTGAMSALDAVYFGKRRAAGERALVDSNTEELFPGNPDRVPAALVSGGAVQDPFRLDDPDPAGRRFHLVNKYTYGIRLPVINKKIIDINEPNEATSWCFATR